MLLLSLVLEIGGGDWVVMYLEFLGLWLGMGNTTDPESSISLDQALIIE